MSHGIFHQLGDVGKSELIQNMGAMSFYGVIGDAKLFGYLAALPAFHYLIQLF